MSFMFLWLGCLLLTLLTGDGAGSPWMRLQVQLDDALKTTARRSSQRKKLHETQSFCGDDADQALDDHPLLTSRFRLHVVTLAGKATMTIRSTKHAAT
jgi:hypothetical protein